MKSRGKAQPRGLEGTTKEGAGDPGIEPMSLMSLALAGGLFTPSVSWEALTVILIYPSIVITGQSFLISIVPLSIL